ncbi:hypothetical protein SAMN05216436_11440 [bacterium A37T11]|nr:hypothetical protein SAMN05216436_11440 [bacterium A37T11]
MLSEILASFNQTFSIAHVATVINPTTGEVDAKSKPITPSSKSITKVHILIEFIL